MGCAGTLEVRHDTCVDIAADSAGSSPPGEKEMQNQPPQSNRVSHQPQVRYSSLRILTGSDLSRRRLPVMSARSANPGPVVWMTAAVHGDEVGGIIVVQEVFRSIRRRLLRGSVHAFPLMNPIGLDTSSRTITVTREDLNRSFPGNPTGSLGERIAHLILSTIMDTGPDLVLDLHNDWIRSIPYVLLDQPTKAISKEADRTAIRFARLTGLCLIREAEALAGTLTLNLLEHGVPAITLELGEPLVVNERNIEYGVRSVQNILSHLEMIDPVETPFAYPVPPPYGGGVILRYSDRPFSSMSGIARFLCKPGDAVKCGQPLVRVVNAFGKQLETIRAIGDGFVLGHSDQSVVFPGTPVVSFGIRD